jgi:homoserine O-succinyltransferase
LSKLIEVVSNAEEHAYHPAVALTMELTIANPTPRVSVPTDGRGPIRIGLINNMPDAALRTTELQVRDLLSRAAGDLPVTLSVFSLPTVPRTDAGLRYVQEHHTPITELCAHGIEGLIVTGTEPRAAALEGEPYWPELAGLIRWSEENTISTVWSCLAAHAAVYLLDHIVRRPLLAKLIGVFECEKVADHPLTANGPERWPVPHSRNNELPEDALIRAGYRILSQSPQAGVDSFVRKGKSLFVFLQGHPEYDATALFGEYRRDVRRYLTNQQDVYPEMPCGYFSAAATEALLMFRERALLERDARLLEDFPASAAGRDISASWRESATNLYSNWLSYISERRSSPADWISSTASV